MREYERAIVFRLGRAKQKALGPGVVLIDSRPLESFSGDKGTWKRRGHLPGAVNRFWNNDLEADGSWKIVHEHTSAPAGDEGKVQLRR